jgi:hypothetical protein
MPVEQVGQVGLGSHVQALRNPGLRHGGFLAQAHSDAELFGSAFALLPQLTLAPPQPVQFLFD